MIINRLPPLEVYSTPSTSAKSIIKKINNIEDADAVLLDSERKQRKDPSREETKKEESDQSLSKEKIEATAITSESEDKAHLDITA